MPNCILNIRPWLSIVVSVETYCSWVAKDEFAIATFETVRAADISCTLRRFCLCYVNLLFLSLEFTCACIWFVSLAAAVRSMRFRDSLVVKWLSGYVRLRNGAFCGLEHDVVL